MVYDACCYGKEYGNISRQIEKKGGFFVKISEQFFFNLLSLFCHQFKAQMTCVSIERKTVQLDIVRTGAT